MFYKNTFIDRIPHNGMYTARIFLPCNDTQVVRADTLRGIKVMITDLLGSYGLNKSL